MSYPLKYLISFASALFIFSLIFFIGNTFTEDVPIFDSFSWIVNLTVLELFSNLFVIQVLAVIFTFAFWTTRKEVKEWGTSPFFSTLRILLIFSLVGLVSYSLKEWVLKEAAIRVMTIEENNRSIDFFKVKILELKAQKNLIEEKMALLGETSSPEYKNLNWQAIKILENLESLYRRYYSIEPTSSLQESIQVANQELALLKERQGEEYSFSFKVPFSDLTEQEIFDLVGKLENQLDYANALYLVRLLSLLYPNEKKYKEEENRLEFILLNSVTNREEEVLRSSFLEKQSYYLAFKAGNYLKAYYGIVDYMRRNSDNVGASEIYSQVIGGMQGKYIFEQDIRDLFEMGGLKSFFFLNDATDSYKEYIYLGKIVESEGSYLVRDISFFRFNSNHNLIFYASLPYATFNTYHQELVFNVIDKEEENPYLFLDVKKGKLDKESNDTWKINYSLREIPAFSLTTFKDFSSLSFGQIWKSSAKAYQMGDKQRVNILFYSVYERILAPFAFLIASFWLASLALLNPVFGERKGIKALLLVISSPAIGALFNFFFSDTVSIFSFLLMSNIFGILIAFILVFFVLLSAISLFIKTIKKEGV